MALFSARYIYDFHITHNTQFLFPKIVHKHSPVCTSPITHVVCSPKFCITSVFHFSWVLQPSQEKLKTMLKQNFTGQTRCILGVANCLQFLLHETTVKPKRNKVQYFVECENGKLSNINNRCNTVFYPSCEKRNEKTLW